ncbi:hypothetical protein [Haloarchaeobius sp. DYHT-AS-18]|uniref:hypothetical protein n=1 Tax=Haloarchaeobius sp. DYHT-AS-18 TaxID=3446117 RepID=UPI003EBB895C
MALVTERDLADTFPTQRGLTAWDRVEEYREVMSYASKHPNKGSSAISTALEVPRGRIRPWLDSDSKPDPVNAIDHAHELGWLDIAPGTDKASGLVKLVAWIYSGGSISAQDYRPTFAVRSSFGGPDNIDLTVLETAFDELGAEPAVVQRENGRATEVRPGSDAVLLGRLLAAAGAPVGDKNESTSITLPDWLPDVFKFHQREFCRIYLLNRAVEREGRPNHRFCIAEERPDAYHQELAEFFETVAGLDGATISEHNLYLSDDLVKEVLD